MSLQPTIRLINVLILKESCHSVLLIRLALYVFVAVCQYDKFIVFNKVQHLQFCEQATQRFVFKLFYPKFSVHKVIVSASLVYIFSAYLSM